jgi:hypothetical protein
MHAGSSFSLFSYLRFAEAASFDKKELCRSDTVQMARLYQPHPVYWKARYTVKTIQNCTVLVVRIVFLDLNYVHTIRTHPKC